ncbi:membrane protein [Aquaticitalea lipolytica]|uniref:Membrane protein n=1 Tax=Aquaticitalea lipolytica TaxID=1247562 RepID=A0A8J2TUB3_9FLAO|nr:M1 family aminopeptidase [Aquaticitalea lipolytica]GFZ93597.1 membrane protein [Aquaticitalea lipolytica]
MLTSLLCFEANYQLKQKAFIAFSIIFLAFGYMLGSQGFAPANVNFNSAYQISYNTALTSLGSVFAIMFFSINGILRDKRYNTESLIYTTSVQKWNYFFSRFFGAFAVSLFVFTMALLGYFLGTLSPSLDPERLMKFHLIYYVWTWLTIVVPNIFICTAIIFSVSALTKNSIATYVSAIFIYAAYFICSMYFNSPLMANTVPGTSENMFFAALADPFGLSAFFEQTQFWTPFQKNTELLHFSGYFMWNRVVWLMVSFLALSVTYKVFSFKKLNPIKIKKTEKEGDKIFQKKTYKTINNIKLNTKSKLLSLMSLLRIELNSLFKSLPFIAVFLLWVFIVASEIYIKINSGGAYNDSLYPTTNLLIELIKDPFPVMCLLLIIFYSGELVWRERSLNFDGIIDATPVSNTALFLSKGVTLVMLPIVLISISILIAIAFQITNNYYHFEIWQYASMFYFMGIGMLFSIMLALFIQAISPNKYLGMITTGLLIIIFQSPVAGSIGIEHPLLKIGKLPYVEFSNMIGYGDYATRFHYYAICWIVLGSILTFISFKIWKRGTTYGLKFKIQELTSNWSKSTRLLFVMQISIFMVLVVAIFYNTNVATEYSTKTDDLDFREGYEKNYKRFESLGQLVFIDIKTKVDLYPKEGKYVINADCVLENTHNKPIDKMLIFERLPLKAIKLERARLIKYDTTYSTYLYEFDRPILPKEKVHLFYELEKKKDGFDIDDAIVNNGTYITSNSFEPVLGYRKRVEITNAFERQKRGLPKREEIVTNDLHLQNDDNPNVRKIYFETTISTESDQTAIAPGDFIKKWSKNNRNFYQYKASHKIIPSIAYFSGAYAIKKENYKGISIEQYYDISQPYNIENIQENVKLALDYCAQNFGPYPFNHLRIVEIPSYWPFGGFAHPGTISMVENRLYLVNNTVEGNFDLVAKRTIHEVAHQWFGHILTPKYGPGASFLVEGFAKYAEAVIMSKEYGMSSVRQLSATANQTYFSGRSFASEKEPSLQFLDGQSYLAYGKSYTVMLALKELIGEDELNMAIKNTIDKNKGDINLNASFLEFFEELNNYVPNEYKLLVDDWLKKVVTYDLKISKGTIKQLDNKYEVTVDVSANRFRTLDNGEEKSISINEPIQIGLFTRHPDIISSTENMLSLKPYMIDKNNMTFKIIVDELPTYIVIDPYSTRLDKNLTDNVFYLN